MELKTVKNFFEQNKKAKIYIVLAVAAAFVLFLFSNGSGATQSSSVSTGTKAEFDKKYEEEITKELIKILSQINGVGKVSVMLTMESTPVYVYSEDTQKTEDNLKTETVIISNKEALIKQVKTPQVAGVLVVCAGGDNIVVKERVINAVSTVLNISSSKVYVTSSN